MADAGNVTSGDLQVVADTSQMVKAFNDALKSLENFTTKTEALNRRIEKSFTSVSDKVVASQKKSKAAADKLTTPATTRGSGRTQAEIRAEAAERRAQRELEVRERSEGRQLVWAGNRSQKAQDRYDAGIQRMVLAEKAKTDKAYANNTRITLAEERRTSELKLKNEQKIAESEQKTLRMQVARDRTIVNRATDRSLMAPQGIQQQIAAILNAPGAQSSRLAAVSGGATRQQSVINQLTQNNIPQGIANYVGGAGGRRPPGWGPNAAQQGGVGGFFQKNFGRIAGAVGTAVGIGAGAFGIGALANAGQALIEATQMATAYDRQEVAARNLAGSQAKLNELLAAYAKNSGGAVDKSTQLSDVTRLLATGFANSVPEVEKFVRATRGASIALGKPQDYITQETQLAISNTSVKRLDQIGLGVDEVQKRIEELQKANAALSREDAFRISVIGLLDAKYGALNNTIEGQVTGLEKLGKAWRDMKLSIGQSGQGPVNGFLGLIGEGIDNATTYSSTRGQYRKNLNDDPTWKPGFGASREEREAYRIEKQMAEADKFWAGFWDKASRGLLKFMGQDPGPGSPKMFLRNPEDFWSGAPGGIPEAPLSRFGKMSDEGKDVVRNSYDAVESIEKDYYEQREQLTKQYEQERTRIIADFGKQMARSEADFQRQRARSLQDYERSILDVMREGREREADWREDLDEKIADATEDHGKKVAEIEEKFRKNQEKAEKDHKDRLLKAAGQLDAIAVLEERKRWKRENEEREEGHQEALKDAREGLEEQVKEAREALEERLKDAREADEKRLQDMALDRERTLARENEDREIEKARQIEDHNAQLDEMSRLHGEQMTKLQEQSEKETKLIEDRLDADLAAVGVYVEGYQKLMRDKDKLIEEWFDKVIKRVEDDIAVKNAPAIFDPSRGPDLITDYIRQVQSGGQGGAITNTSSRVNVIEAGAIAVFTTPGFEMMVGELVEEKMLEVLER